jgi:hypothetical protein
MLGAQGPLSIVPSTLGCPYVAACAAVRYGGPKHRISAKAYFDGTLVRHWVDAARGATRVCFINRSALEHVARIRL